MSRSFCFTWPSLVLVALVAASLFTCTTCGMLPIESSSEPGFAMGSLDYDAAGGLTRGRLLEAREIEGWPAIGWVMWEGGRLETFDLAEEFTPPGWSPGRSLPAGTRVSLVAGGVSPGTVDFVFLPHEMTLEGLPVAGGAGKIMCGFYPDGSPRFVFLSKDTQVQGLPVESSLFTPLRFHPNGKVESCPLAKPIERDGRKVSAGSVVHFDEAGKLVAVD
jgi:hypothetical protein